MYRSVRRETYELFTPELGGEVGRWVDWFILILILANVTAVMLETVDPLRMQYEAFFWQFELFSVVVFTIEYVARVWAAVENGDYEHPVWGRIRYAFRPLVMVDFLAILPFYLLLIGPAVDLRFLRALRLVRLLRLMKLARYSESIRAFGVVLRHKKPDLLIALFANSLMLILASSVMYYVEHEAQPEAFGSIPETMWWGVATLTTVGYGDVTPVTPVGKFFAAVVAVLGIGMFALPASILASGFVEVATENAGDDVGGDTSEEDRKNRGREEDPREKYSYCPHCGERLDD
ncbi:potassium channel protein [Halobacteriales archaeon QS_8_69_26]|nr:MAG: potassium channel protein [Halobacteriales archaeon QS_8_69_26]